MNTMKKNKTKRRLCFLLTAFITVACLAGCGPSAVSTPSPSAASRTIVDSVGREVEIPAEVKTVAAVDSFSGEVMVMIGAGDRLVAGPNGIKRDMLLQAIYPQLSDLTVVQAEGAINAEALMALRPDVILLKNSFYIAKTEADKIDKLGIPYLVTKFDTMEEQMKALKMIGEVLGGEPQKKAQFMSDYYRKTLALAKERSALIPEEKKIRVYHALNELIRTDGDQSLGADWTDAVGLINVSVGEGLVMDSDNYYASAEQIFVWDPDMVICNEATTALYLKTSEKWTGLRAVTDGKIYNIPIGATRWGQQNSVEVYFAILWAGVTLYPEYYGDIDLKKEVTTFYRDVLGLEIDGATYEMILSGEGIRTPGNQNKNR